ncbi:MAG: hypothetical protein ABIK44_00905 [candidate division WOR-3 bacterium]
MSRVVFFGLCLRVALAAAQVMIDTVGWTSRDRQVYGPAVRFIVNDTLSGIHVVWKDSLSAIRYNFRPRQGGWRWENGIVINSYPRNLGCLDVDITRGSALISTDYLSLGVPQLSYFQDTSRGWGKFVEFTFARGSRNNLIAATNYGWPKFAAIRDETLYFQSSWTSYRMGAVGPFPAHNLAASKQSGRLGCIWAVSSGPDRGALYLRQTPNNGGQWYPLVKLSDSVPSALNRTLNGGFATYDTIRIHLVAEFYDGRNPCLSQLWHYCPYDTPSWHLVHECSLPESSRLGDHALAAGRPSIGIDRPKRRGDINRLYVVWEQFDPENIEPRTGLARADIWAASSDDNGRTWNRAVRLTEPDSTSKRFPFLAEVVDDTLHIICFADRIAGFWEQGQGEPTRNPVLYLRVPATALSGIAKGQPLSADREPRAAAIVRRTLFLNRGEDAVPTILLDATGRKMLVLHPGANDLRHLAPGVYFMRRAEGGWREAIVRVR